MITGHPSFIQVAATLWTDLAPVIQGVASHPALSIAFGLFGLFVLWGLMRGLTHLAEQLWLALLRLPWWVGQKTWILLRGRPSLAKSTLPTTGEISQIQALQALLTQIEQLQEEQKALLLEAKTQLNQLDPLK